MADLKVKLQNSNGDNLYPQASVDNLVASAGGASVSVAVLDSTGKVPASMIPSQTVTVPIANSTTVGGVTLDGTVFTTSGTSGTLVAGAITATSWGGLQTTETKLVTGGKMKTLVDNAITSGTSTFISGVTAGTGIEVDASGTTVSLDATNNYDLKYVLL